MSGCDLTPSVLLRRIIKDAAASAASKPLPKSRAGCSNALLARSATIPAPHLFERPNKVRRSCYMISIDPSSRTALKTELPIKATEYLLHLRRQNLERLA